MIGASARLADDCAALTGQPNDVGGDHEQNANLKVRFLERPQCQLLAQAYR
jgi:hypothetical protein